MCWAALFTRSFVLTFKNTLAESNLATSVTVHRSLGELSQGPHRSGEGAQEKVRKADGQVLRQPGAVPRPFDQKAGHRLARGRTPWLVFVRNSYLGWHRALLGFQQPGIQFHLERKRVKLAKKAAVGTY